MDKQKQIEEMAGISYGIFTADNHCPFDKNCPYLGGKIRFGCNDCLRAVAIINAGYRKIPEGSVVLTREELEKYMGCELATMVVRIVHLEKQSLNLRKETAEKFAQALENRLDSIDTILHEDNEEEYLSANEIGELIDEVCNEITGEKL